MISGVWQHQDILISAKYMIEYSEQHKIINGVKFPPRQLEHEEIPTLA